MVNSIVDAIEAKLEGKQWLSGGQQPSKEDAEQFVALGGSAPNVDFHPNAFAWYCMVSRFTEAKRSTWAAAPAAAASAADKGAKEGGKGRGKKDKGGAQAAAAEESKKPAIVNK